MKGIATFRVYMLLLAGLITGISCNNKDDKHQDNPGKDTTKTAEKKEAKKEPEPEYQRPPIINIVDTLAPRRIVAFMKDSAASVERISPKLNAIWGTKLPEYLKKNNLKAAGAPMAWFRNQKAPYFFEAGIPVNKKGNKTVKGVQVKDMPAGKVIVAHFYGPYELLSQGYDAIKEFMKENKKVAAGAPYEIYITSHLDKDGKPVDPYKVQTDIVFPIR
jgi:effector-binding domain-containing protein